MHSCMHSFQSAVLQSVSTVLPHLLHTLHPLAYNPFVTTDSFFSSCAVRLQVCAAGGSDCGDGSEERLEWDHHQRLHPRCVARCKAMAGDSSA